MIYLKIKAEFVSMQWNHYSTATLSLYVVFAMVHTFNKYSIEKY